MRRGERSKLVAKDAGNRDVLRLSFFRLRKDAASGVDGVTFQQYEGNLETNLADLEGRLKRKAYRARLMRPQQQGRCRLIRYADVFVACFEYRHETEAFEQGLKERLAKFGLEVAADKTKTLRFGHNGGPHNGRFDFLGFEFYWEPDRQGQPRVKRRTATKKWRAGVQRMTEWVMGIVFLVVPLVLKAALATNLLQRGQDLHHTHQKPIPRLGGLALAVAFVGLEVFIAAVFPEQRAKIPGAGRPVVLVSSLAMFALGFWDDLKPLGARRKLAGQIVIAAAVCALGIGIQ
jgi:hypothetical protein